MTRFRAAAVLFNDIAGELTRVRGHVRGIDLMAEGLTDDGDQRAFQLACDGMDRRLDRIDALLLELGECLVPQDRAA